MPSLPSKYRFRLDYQGAGLHGVPRLRGDLALPDRPPSDAWLFCTYALDRAKSGDFAHIPSLVDLYGKTGDLEVDSLCMGFLAAAGPASAFSRIVQLVKQPMDMSRALPLCGAMSVRGELSYVPIFLRQIRHRRNKRRCAASSRVHQGATRLHTILG